MRVVTQVAAAAVGMLIVALGASVVIAPAGADQPLTLYVDQRIGSDDFDGRTPERALKTLDAAVAHAEPGADILLTGYGDQLTYRGTGTRCVTLVGTEDEPVQIRRNVYTNTLHPAVLTTDRVVDEPWVAEEQARGKTTWSTPWPGEIALFGPPALGFVKVGQLALHGFVDEPPLGAGDAAWWEDGRVYARMAGVDPNEHRAVVKDGDGLCLSADSRHVVIKDLSVHGAAHAVRVQQGAVDITVEHIVRHNVLDDDPIPASATPAAGNGATDGNGAGNR